MVCFVFKIVIHRNVCAIVTNLTSRCFNKHTFTK